MTYLYYKTSTWTGNPQVNEKTKEQLPNGYYQTEVNHPDDDDKWSDVTRRETLEGAESAIDGSIEHFSKKLEATKGPKVVKTFNK